MCLYSKPILASITLLLSNACKGTYVHFCQYGSCNYSCRYLLQDAKTIFAYFLPGYYCVTIQTRDRFDKIHIYLRNSKNLVVQYDWLSASCSCEEDTFRYPFNLE